MSGKEKIKNYRKDGYLYALWRYANGERFSVKKSITFQDLNFIDETFSRFTLSLLSYLRENKIKLEGIFFPKAIYKRDFKKECEAIEIFIKNKENKFAEILKGIFDSETNVDDLHFLVEKGLFLGELEELKSEIINVLKLIEFNSNPAEESLEIINKDISSYINCFINDSLQFYDFQSFYNFSKHKQILISDLKDKISNHGKEFIIKEIKSCPIDYNCQKLPYKSHKDEYLFIHILIALEELEFLKVKNITLQKKTVSDKNIELYKVKIKCSEKLINYHKRDGKEITRDSITLNEKNGMLKIGGKDVKFRKKTNQYYLLQSFFNDGKMYKENIYLGDITEDGDHPLGGKGDKIIRNTAGNIRRKVERKTNIKNFICVKDEEVRVNFP